MIQCYLTFQDFRQLRFNNAVYQSFYTFTFLQHFFWIVLTKECGLIVNSSRAIIYADKTENFANVAAEEAQKVQQQMEKELAAIL